MTGPVNAMNEEYRQAMAATIDRLEQEKDLACLLYTSDAADERSSVDLGGRRIIKKKNNKIITGRHDDKQNTNNKQKE